MCILTRAIYSYAENIKRLEQEQQEQIQEAVRKFKDQESCQEFKDGTQAVEDWKSYVNTIQSVHKSPITPIDWGQIHETSTPQKPVIELANKERALKKLEDFKPSLWDRLFGSTEMKLAQLELEVEKAELLDKKEFASLMDEYWQQTEEWKTLRKMANGIRKRQAQSYQSALDYFSPFSDIAELGTQLSINVQSNFIDIDLRVKKDMVIPNYELKQTINGEASKKSMSTEKSNELYRNHLCSTAIKIAKKAFSYLPVQKTRVNAITNLLNTQTEHLEDQPILSVVFVPETLNKLNFDAAPALDSLQNFTHNMRFSKTQGFKMVSKVRG